MADKSGGSDSDVRRMFEELLEVAPDAIVGVNSDGLVILVNQQAETVFGYTRDELLWKSGRGAHAGALAWPMADTARDSSPSPVLAR